MSKKVLAVDDRVSGRELTRTVLEYSGHLVFEATNGIETVRIARELTPDLILFDPHTPGIDGFGLLKTLRQDPASRGTLIVALTSSARSGDRERVLSAGFDAYISKPIPPNLLRGEVDVLLGL